METMCELFEENLDDLSLFLKDKPFVDQLKNLVYHGARALEVSKVIVIVDYTRPLSEILMDSWHSIESGCINEKYFPVSTRQRLFGRREIIRTKLFHFNEKIDSKDVEKVMAEEGYRPATLAELLAFSQNNKVMFLPNIFPIVALTPSKILDSTDEDGLDALDDLHVAVLGIVEANETILRGKPYSQTWHYNHRFLGVRI
ncbi:MAG: hypothetical protein WCT50_03085 [Patescibacteria group bacterium]